MLMAPENVALVARRLKPNQLTNINLHHPTAYLSTIIETVNISTKHATDFNSANIQTYCKRKSQIHCHHVVVIPPISTSLLPSTHQPTSPPSTSVPTSIPSTPPSLGPTSSNPTQTVSPKQKTMSSFSLRGLLVQRNHFTTESHPVLPS